MKKPNLLLYISDHFRKEALSHMGNRASFTKHLDAFAKDAVSFENAFCQNPVCVPSRCSFLSGNYPHNGGFRTMHHLQSECDGNILIELKRNGYHIYFGGKNDVFKQDVPMEAYCDYRSDAFTEMSCLEKGIPLPKGYHSVLQHYTRENALKAKEVKEHCRNTSDDKRYYALYQGVVESENDLEVGYMGAEDAQINDAIQYIHTYQGEAPLCVYLSLVLPHPQYACTPQDMAQISSEDIEPCIRLSETQIQKKPSILQGMRENFRLQQWSDNELLNFKQTYYAMVHHVDENFGKVIHCLKDKQLYDDMMIFMFSDHGDYAGEYEIVEINQNTFEDVLTNVPLLIKPQKGIDILSGNNDSLVELLDIPATIADFTDITLSYPIFGRSLRGAMQGKSHRKFVHCEGGRRKDELHCMDAGHDTNHLYWPRTSEQAKIPQHTKAYMIRDQEFKYVYRLYEMDEFYDLKKDPKECENQINEHQYVDDIRRMKDELLKFMIETSDQVPYHKDAR